MRIGVVGTAIRRNIKGLRVMLEMLVHRSQTFKVWVNCFCQALKVWLRCLSQSDADVCGGHKNARPARKERGAGGSAVKPGDLNET
jgi:hypothetical protein